ncbi:MAG: PadR family transcriptional regulator [Calditrichaeota bacterium]|nr:MAG: PadR family transcriptional regulator [Calditrichota bacterium]
MPNQPRKQGCRCYDERQSRWVEPSILYLLWSKPNHGYDLMISLPELGFFTGSADPGAIYRTLHHLEHVGLVSSNWDNTGSGPAKRLYTITELGQDHLRLWTAALRKRMHAIDSFIQKVQELE